jgi:pimeloyl-ACP methyl ester carboxylesterase
VRTTGAICATSPAPTLAGGGALGPVVPLLNLRRIAARVPGARFQRFGGAHAFLFQSRARFARAVAAFLR